MKWPFSPSVQPPAASNDAPTVLKLDLGCGTKKHAGFLGIDRRSFAGVDGVADLTHRRWVFAQNELGGCKLQPHGIGAAAGFELPDSSVTEVHCSHFLEHLEHNQQRPERVRFMNELWRVLVPGGTATIVTPHWASSSAYGDFTHADKPVSEFFYSYLNRDWRKRCAPDNDIEFNPDGYDCDFDWELGHSLHPTILERPAEEKAYAVQWYKEAAQELFARLTARK